MTAQRRVRPDPAQHPAWYESIGSFETPVEIFDFQFGTISKYCRLHELEGTTKDIREQLERKDEELTRGKSEVEELKRKLHIAEMQRNSVAERAIQDLSVARF
jgi:cell division protein FtsL